MSLVRAGDVQVSRVEQNDFVVTATGERAIDITHAGAPILINGVLFAKGEDTSALRVHVEAADGEHTLVTIDGAGEAAEVGIVFDEVSGFLSRGGFRAFTPEAEEPFVPAFPTEGSIDLKGARKVLLGPAGRSLAVVAADDDGRLDCVARVDGDARVCAFGGKPDGGAFKFRLKTDLSGEVQEAQMRMNEALRRFDAGAWGEFSQQAQQALAEFPFGQRGLRKQLQDRLKTVSDEYAHLRERVDDQLGDYKEFRDLQSLDNVVEAIETLRGKFQIEPGKGEMGEHLARAAEREEQLRREALAKKQGEIAKAYFEQAVYSGLPDKPYSAALLLSYVAWYLPDSPQAPQARDELTKIEKEHPEVVEVLRKLGFGKEG
jgi:hypothetical protein